MAQSAPVQPIPELNPDAKIGASVATRWTTWLSDFERFVLASGITDTKRQWALLLYTAGSKFFNKFPTKRTKTISKWQRRNSPNISSPKLTADMKFTGSGKPNKIKNNRWTSSTLAYEHLSKIVNLQKIIWNSKSNNKFWLVERPPESVNGLQETRNIP